MNYSLPRWKFVLLVFPLISLMGCEGFFEPKYSGLAGVLFNYTPLNVDDVTVKDAFGNKLFAGGGVPGEGEGRFACCYTLKGEEMTIEWTTYDRATYLKEDKKTAKALITKNLLEMSKSIKSGFLNIHIYPDDHVELEYTNGMLGKTRIDIVEVVRWLVQQPDFNKYDAIRMQFVVGAVTSDAWKKYGFTHLEDLKSYSFFVLHVNREFDVHPDIQALIQKNKAEPGSFAVAMNNLPVDVISKLKLAGAASPHPMLKAAEKDSVQIK